MKIGQMNDAQLQERSTMLHAELTTLESEHRWTRDDAVEAGEAWIERAKAQMALRPAEAWPSGSKSLHPQAILEVVAAFVLSSHEFKRWLRERLGWIGDNEAPGVSGLSRAERDKQLAQIRGSIAAAEQELKRRGIHRRREELESELAALSLGGDAA